MSRRAIGTFALLAALDPRPAHGDANALPKAAQPACEQEPTSVQRSACAVASALGGSADSAQIVAAANATGTQPTLSPGFSERLARLVAQRLGAGAEAKAGALSPADALRSASSARGLIYLRPTLYRDRLEIAGDVYTGAGHFWQRLRSPGLKLTRHVVLATPLDPELRALFPAIPVLVTRIDKALGSEREIMALACGDLKGDGSTEIVLVSRRKVQIGRLEGARFQARRSLDWSDVSSVAESPLREPLGACSISETRQLWVGLSDRADALELSSSLHLEHAWPGIMPWPGGGCTRRAGLGYEGRVDACPGAAPMPVIDFGTSLDALATRSLADQRGQPHTLRVARPLGSDVARALDSRIPEVALPNSGPQLAVGDLDDDGVAEIVTSSPSLDRSSDQLVVRSLSATGQLRERLRVAVPSGIDAITICPGDGRSMAPLALATGDSVWVIR